MTEKPVIPATRHRIPLMEFSLRDPDGYYVTISSLNAA